MAAAALTSTARSIPDISADADLFTGFAVGEPFPGRHGLVFALTDIGGTSLAAPLVAGMVTDAQQLLISLDDQRQRLRGSVGQVALPGYDNITGVGTPNFPAFVAALRAAG